MIPYIERARTGEAAAGAIRAPVEAGHEIWACGVTYQRSRDPRGAEAQTRDIYTAVYEAKRPELFYKAPGWRARGMARRYGSAPGVLRGRFPTHPPERSCRI